VPSGDREKTSDAASNQEYLDSPISLEEQSQQAGHALTLASIRIGYRHNWSNLSCPNHHHQDMKPFKINELQESQDDPNGILKGRNPYATSVDSLDGTHLNRSSRNSLNINGLVGLAPRPCPVFGRVVPPDSDFVENSYHLSIGEFRRSLLPCTSKKKLANRPQLGSSKGSFAYPLGVCTFRLRAKRSEESELISCRTTFCRAKMPSAGPIESATRLRQDFE
jgi:hypothetical protein